MVARLVMIAALVMPFPLAGQQGPPPKMDTTPHSIDAPPPPVSATHASVGATPQSVNGALIAQATRDAAEAVLANRFADALAACERGLQLDPRNSYLHYYKSSALRSRGVQSWNAGDKMKDEKLKNEARADWTAVVAVADEALATLVPSAPQYIELHYRFVREKAEVQFLLAHTSGIARPEAVASLDLAIAEAQDPRLPRDPSAGLGVVDPKLAPAAAGKPGSVYVRPELVRLKRSKAELLLDNASAADAVAARALYSEVLAADPQDYTAMVGMSTACIIALDWTASKTRLNQGAQACVREAVAFRAQVPPADPRSARLQLLIDALQQLDQQ